MVVVDEISKVAHFIPMKSTFKEINIVDILIKEIFWFHQISKVVISHRDAQFTSNVFKSMFKGMDNQPNFSTSYHHQKDDVTTLLYALKFW